MFQSISHKYIKFGLVVLLIIGIFFLLRDERTITNYPSQGSDIIAFGDSLVAGVGSSTGGFVDMLSKDLGVEVVNLGISGNTTKDALDRVEVLKDYKPKLVMILLGGNDFLRKVPTEETFANLDKIVRVVVNQGSVVVLLGVRSGVLSNRYDEEYEKLASKYGAVYVSDVLDGVFGRPNLMYDTIHPNDLGYRIIADRLNPVIKKLIQ
ncbi:MAG TPA: GDSL-type esterase/lipase family protein [Parcubacteria group bacterium]|nr:GDSL-type esterase/lipase family protein [Parcubacteria group bacterium]